MLTPFLTCSLMYVMCSYLLHVYHLEVALAGEPSSGVTIGVPATSFELERSGNISILCM
jgi:hypothetical protein